MWCLGRWPLVNNGLFDLDTWCLDRWFLASIFHNLRRLSCEALRLLCFGLLLLPQLWCRRKRNLSRLCRCLRQRNLSLLCRCLLLRKLQIWICRSRLSCFSRTSPKRDQALQLLLRNGKGLCKLGAVFFEPAIAIDVVCNGGVCKAACCKYKYIQKMAMVCRGLMCVQSDMPQVQDIKVAPATTAAVPMLS